MLLRANLAKPRNVETGLSQLLLHAKYTCNKDFLSKKKNNTQPQSSYNKGDNSCSAAGHYTVLKMSSVWEIGRLVSLLLPLP